MRLRATKTPGLFEAAPPARDFWDGVIPGLFVVVAVLAPSQFARVFGARRLDQRPRPWVWGFALGALSVTAVFAAHLLYLWRLLAAG